MIRVVVEHSSHDYRAAIRVGLDSTRFAVEEPSNVARWVAGPGRRVLVTGALDPDGVALIDAAVAAPNCLVVAVVNEPTVRAWRDLLAIGVDAVTEQVPARKLRQVLEATLAGELLVPIEVARALTGRPGDPPSSRALSDDERSLLQRLSEGATVARIATETFQSERSVRRRFARICAKMQVGSRSEALKRAAQLHLID